MSWELEGPGVALFARAKARTRSAYRSPTSSCEPRLCLFRSLPLMPPLALWTHNSPFHTNIFVLLLFPPMLHTRPLNAITRLPRIRTAAASIGFANESPTYFYVPIYSSFLFPLSLFQQRFIFFILFFFFVVVYN